MTDWLIEAARRPVGKCDHDLSWPQFVCIKCGMTAEQICNAREGAGVQMPVIPSGSLVFGSVDRMVVWQGDQVVVIVQNPR